MGTALYFVSGGSGSADIAISNSIAGSNKGRGITASGGSAMTISIDNSTIKGNAEGVLGTGAS